MMFVILNLGYKDNTIRKLLYFIQITFYGVE
jgi:hypothetical protein